MNATVIAASIASERNLLSYFDSWKFPITQTTRDAVNAMGLADLQFYLVLRTVRCLLAEGSIGSI